MAPLRVPDQGRPGFTLLPGFEAGILFTNYVSRETSLKNSIINNGAGVAAGDVDGDGWCDLYFCGLENSNSLYRNLGGWKFEDITQAAGVACSGQLSTGAVFADVDGDERLDLLVNCIGAGTRLFINNRYGRFEERKEAGLIQKLCAMSMALGDIDNDGDLDLYVTNYRTSTIQDEPGTRFSVVSEQGKLTVKSVNGRPVTNPALAERFEVGPDGDIIENAEPDLLYLNDGHGFFRPADWTTGTFLDENGAPLREAPRDWGLSVMFRDMNLDLAPDIYVCNDAESPDRVWMNDGGGRFRAWDSLAIRLTSLSSMGVDFADLDRDGHDEFIVLDMLARNYQRRQTQLELPKKSPGSFGTHAPRLQLPRNTLFLNLGDGTYAEIAQLAGLHASDWSWTPIFLDVDLDGYEDLLISTGFHRDVRDQDILETIELRKRQERINPQEQLAMRSLFPSWPTTVAAFRNRGDLTFQDTSANWGFTTLGIYQGTAAADLDNDGDLDLVINRFNDAPALWRNNAVAPRVAVRLKGKTPNTAGVGARILYTSALPQQSQEMLCGGRYLSSDDTMKVFASIGEKGVLEILWRSMKKSIVENVQPNQLYEVIEP